MDRIGRLASIGCHAVVIGALAINSALALPTLNAQAAGWSTEMSTSGCDGQPLAQLPSWLSSFVAKAIPFLNEAAPGMPTIPRLATLSSPSATASVQTLPEVDESIAAMRALSKIDVQWQATFLAPIGSGWFTLTPPDVVAGQGSMVATRWKVETSNDQAVLQINDSTIGGFPAKGIATTLRDAVLAAPCHVPNASLHQDGDVDLFEGRLSPGGGSDLLRQLTGLVVPGNPTGQISLAIDRRTKIWRTMDLRLVWAIVDVEILGRRITWGPGGRVWLTFADGAAPSTMVATASEERRPSTAHVLLGRLEEMPALHPYLDVIQSACTFLDVRQVPVMLDDEPRQRAAVIIAWQRHGGHSSEYQDALRQYEAWERQIPLIGPFLRFIFHEMANP
jgi:hypothetical protein